MNKYLSAAALTVMLTQCAPECAPDPAGTDGPQMEQLQASSSVVPGDCDSYVPLFEAYGLPVATFKRIAWRESGCNHRSWVFNRTDSGGGLLGINFKGSLAAGWYRWCGATLSNFRDDPNLQVRCAREAYDRMGMAPWQ